MIFALKSFGYVYIYIYLAADIYLPYSAWLEKHLGPRFLTLSDFGKTMEFPKTATGHAYVSRL